ncbi:MAG: hypothetical protein VKJ24_12775 [Synechococcales bacterium]|nr:hypothetical protein [Synechococcales bacterium]
MKTTLLRQAPHLILLRWLGRLLPPAMLVGTVGLVVTSGVLSVQFILEPRSIAWLNQYLPAHLQIPIAQFDKPIPLSKIRQALQNSGQDLGEAIDLPGNAQLYPVIQQEFNCKAPCDQMIELRVYRPAEPLQRQSTTETHYQLVSRLVTEGLPEWVAREPLVAVRSGDPGSAQEWPLETVEIFETAIDPTPQNKSSDVGIWLNLTGKRQQGDATFTYGQLVHYNPRRSELSALTTWTSPIEAMPKWQQVTGTAQPELVVDQSVDLEPQFRIYQLNQQNSRIQLNPISLTKPAIAHPEYRAALTLTQGGLWSLAYQRLQRLKDQGIPWSGNAQAQMDVIKYHAQISQQQVEQPWANMSQQVTVNLIDGRWQRAIALLEQSKTERKVILDELRLESAQVWRRVDIALKVWSADPYAQAWGAVLVEGREGTIAAKNWLKRQRNQHSTLRNQALQKLAPNLAPTPKALEVSNRTP